MACEQIRANSTKAPGRSRWNANQQQLQNLEGIFEQGNGNTPNKARIKDIALELSQYGQISETNVYNWFQNRKARAKRKLQQRVGRTRRLSRTAAESALKLREDRVSTGEETLTGDVTSPRAKRLKSEGDQVQVVDQTEPLSLAPNSDLCAGSSSVAEEIEGVLEEELRSPVAFACTLAINPQLASVDVAHDMLFNEDHFHDQGTFEYPSDSPLQEASHVEVKAWDGRTINSFGQSSHVVEYPLPPYHHLNSSPSGLAGDKLISMAGGPVHSMD